MNRPRSLRRYFQFNLRFALLAMGCCSIGLAPLANALQQVQREQRAIALLPNPDSFQSVYEEPKAAPPIPIFS